MSAAGVSAPAPPERSSSAGSRGGRGQSLFWTIAGIFLVTVIAGAVIQGLIAVAVLRPLESRDARARAELAVSTLAEDLAAAPVPPRGADLDSVLARGRAMLGPHPGWIVFRFEDGTLATAPGGGARSVRRFLAGGDPDSGRIADGGPPRRRLELIASRRIATRSGLRGEILVVRPLWPNDWGGLIGPRGGALLVIPIAILTSLLAGFVMVRLLVRRLRAMEMLAARVAEGDLSARIADRSGDEIGRLARQLDRMTESLARARTEIEDNEQQRRQLFADITHELATPLTAIRGYAETLLDPAVPMNDDARTRYVRGVAEESSRLDRLIRDLFDLARLEAGAAALVKEPLDWSALARNTIARFEPRFRAAGLSIEWRGGADEAWIRADGRRIEQVLDNLLGNALRYVPAGGRVALSLARTGDGSGFRLTVADDGPGVPAHELPRMFERFYRGTPAPGPRDQGGAGLGLAIVREIVERHGGTVTARAGEPRGLVVEVVLPA